MGDEEATEREPVLDHRTDRPTMHGQKKREMDALGWIIFVCLFILVIPLIPGILLVLLLAKILGVDGRTSVEWGKSQLPY